MNKKLCECGAEAQWEHCLNSKEVLCDKCYQKWYKEKQKDNEKIIID